MPPKATLRFKVGQHVLCRMGADEWEPGQITQLHWVSPWDGRVNPYQVRMLGDGRLIFVPHDGDECCKALERVWWEELVEREDLSDKEGVLALRKQCEGKDVNAKNHLEATGLITAVEMKWEAGVEALLELKADPNLGGKHLRRPLHWAVYMDKVTVELLLKARADPNLQDKDPDKDPDFDSKSFEEREWHRTALHYAAEDAVRDDPSILSVLLEGRADPNALDAQCKMPLHLAIEAHCTAKVALLCEARADVNAGNYSLGMTTSPLVDAAYRNDLEVMGLLIAARADLDQRGKQGMTALHMAARGRHPDAAKKLLEARADVTITAMGKTAGELAARNGMDEIAGLLGHAPDTKENMPNYTAKNSKIPHLDEKTRASLFMD